MNKWKILILLLLLFVGIGIYVNFRDPTPVVKAVPDRIIAQNLEIPWSMVFLPDGSLLFTERPGRVRMITSSGAVLETPVFTVKDVKAFGEGGLLGIATHPDFLKNHYVYLYYTYSTNSQDTLNKVVRYSFIGNQFQNPKIIVGNIPGNVNHNGGRLKFGPDGYLYITTGDSLNPSLAQNKNALAGKILRVTDDGKPAPGNPFNNLVYSFGHRNPQGLAWDDKGQLWETEHGPTAHDEINLIKKGANYGWPTIVGNQTAYGMETPILTSGNNTWAPSGLLFLKPSLIFAGLRSTDLFKYDPSTKILNKYLTDKYGRLRDVVLGPDGFIYISTSNMDGRALTHLDGDKIIRVDPAGLN
ncbi:MAG TPA: PQQ-dependent sugar dehydrogenase [Patescibacteria group bacterium]